MRSITAAITILWMGQLVFCINLEGSGLRRIRRGLRFIPKYEQYARTSSNHVEEESTNHNATVDEANATPKKEDDDAASGRYYYQQDFRNSGNAFVEGEEKEYETAVTATSTSAQHDRDRFHDKTFGDAYLTEDGFGDEDVDWDSRGIPDFSMPSMPSTPGTTQPKPPPPSSAPAPTPPTTPPPTSPPGPNLTPLPTTARPAANPTPAPIPQPVVNPTPAPVPAPTPQPTARPTVAPVLPPSEAPSFSPSTLPTALVLPTNSPTRPPAEPPTREDREVLIQAKCGITGLERSRDILVELLKVSRAPNLVNPVTSQFAARDWIDNVDEAIVCPENMERIHQRYRLALLYFQMGGSQWTRCRAGDTTLTVVYDDLEIMADEGCPGTPFLDKTNECEWYGVSCGDGYDPMQAEMLDEYFPLDALDLQANNLNGELFDELYGFGQLEQMLLNGNQRISGTISEDISALVNVQDLNLGGNLISGSLPSEIYSLSELTALGLEKNVLVGGISNDIGSLTKLQTLRLQSNMLDGAVPETGLFQLEQLEELSIQDNGFEGSLNVLCAARDERREDLPTYLDTIQADCEEVTCSCCQCS